MRGLIDIVTAVLGGGLGLRYDGTGSFWMPPPGSTSAAQVDSVFNFILWVSVIFFPWARTTLPDGIRHESVNR